MSLLEPSPPLRQLTGRQIQWIAAGFMLTFASLPGQTIFIAQFNTSIREAFNLSHGGFGFLYTLATLASSICLIFVGGLTDRFSARKIAIICLLGLALAGFSMSVAPHIIVVGIALFGLRLFGQGMMTQIAATTMARWFNRYRGRALAISNLGGSLGDSLLPFTAAFLITLMAWQQVWMIAASFIVLILVPVIFFLLRDPPDGRRAKERGDINPDSSAEEGLSGQEWTRSAVLKDRLFYALVAGMMAPPAITTLFFFHQAHLADIKSWPPLSIAAFFPIVAISSIVFGLISGTLIDRFGAARLLVFMLIPEGLACFVIAMVTPIWAIPLFFVLIGMTHGIMAPASSAIWAEIYGTAHIGTIRALSTACLVFASAVGPGLAGALIDVGFELTTQGFVYGTLCLVGALGFALLQKTLIARSQPSKA